MKGIFNSWLEKLGKRKGVVSSTILVFMGIVAIIVNSRSDIAKNGDQMWGAGVAHADIPTG